MKSLFTVIFVGLAAVSFGQTSGKWSVGVGYTPAIMGGSTFVVYVNRHLSDKWQIGLIPFGYFDSYSNPVGSSYKTASLGLNLSSRFSPVKYGLFKPYMYAFGGYGYSTIRFLYTNSPDRVSQSNILNFSLGIGTEIDITKTGWSIDANFGYLRLNYWDTDDGGKGYGYLPVFTVGVLKRFGKIKK